MTIGLHKTVLEKRKNTAYGLTEDDKEALWKSGVSG